MEIKSSEELIKKVNELKEKVVDLSSDEDLVLGVMNLINMEEHLYFTAEKTGKTEYFDLLNQIRETRKKMMERLIKKPEGELWCFIKHTLSATMRLIEVGTKLYSQNKKDEAKEVYDLAYELFNIFWGIKLNIINLEEMRQEIKKTEEISKEPEEKQFSLKKLIEKLIDCCKE